MILPGSKSTAADLAWLRASGIAGAIEGRVREGKPVLGICGGCQMLGELIEDSHGVESTETQVCGLGLLALRTRFEREKVTAGLALEGDVSGYEIHMGIVEPKNRQASTFQIQSRNGRMEGTQRRSHQRQWDGGRHCAAWPLRMW